MAKEGAGTKRVCPETGKKFYDLEKDPIISPYTGKEYPLSFFDEGAAADKPADKASEDEADNDEIELETGSSAESGPEFVALEDADDDSDDDDVENIPDIDGDEDDEISVDEDDNTFLETDDDENNDVSDLVGGGGDDEDS